jgi:Spy/CpxP family protein refolding chaperone
MKTRIASILMVTLFFISTALIAQPRNQGENWGQNQDREQMKQKRFAENKRMPQNFFTEEQKETMKEMRLEMAKQIKPVKNELRELMARQKTLTTADKVDMKAINKNIDKMSDAKTEMAKIMAAQHQQVRSLLTEEQLIKFDSMKAKKGNKRGRKFGNSNGKRSGQMQHRRGA